MNVRAKEKDIRTKKEGLAVISELLSQHSKLLSEKRSIEGRVELNNTALMKELQMFFVDLSEKYKRHILISIYDGRIQASVKLYSDGMPFTITITKNMERITKHLSETITTIKTELENILSKAKDGKIEFSVKESNNEIDKPLISLDTRTKYFR